MSQANNRHYKSLLDHLAQRVDPNLVRETPKVLEEEINKLCNDIPSDELVDTLKQLTENSHKILGSLEQVSDWEFNHDNQIVREHWKFFAGTLQQLVEMPEFQKRCKYTYLKLYATKHFTQAQFISQDKIEDNLKLEVKEYFDKLSTEDPDEFIDRLFSLPFDFLGLVVRFLSHNVAPQLKPNLIPTKQEAEAFLHEVLERKQEFIDRLIKITQFEHNVFSLTDAKLLLDIRAFIEPINVNYAILEYLMRLLKHDATRERLYDMFDREQVQEIEDQISSHSNYAQFLAEVRAGTNQPFFTLEGTMEAGRGQTFTDAVEEYLYPELIAQKAVDQEQGAIDIPGEPVGAEIAPPEDPGAEAPIDVEPAGDEEEGAIEIPAGP